MVEKFPVLLLQLVVRPFALLVFAGGFLYLHVRLLVCRLQTNEIFALTIDDPLLVVNRQTQALVLLAQLLVFVLCCRLECRLDGGFNATNGAVDGGFDVGVVAVVVL